MASSRGVGITPAGRAIAAAMGSRFGVGNSKYHYATTELEVDHLPFGAYPVDLLREVGGWDETLVANEDYELDYRLRRRGGRLLLDPRVVIAWQCRQSVPDLYQQYVRYGKGKADVAMLHPASLSARHVVAPALVAWLALAALRAGRHPAQAALMVSPYVAGVAVATRQTRPVLENDADWVHLPGAFTAMHVGWGYGFGRGSCVVWCVDAPPVSPAAGTSRAARPGRASPSGRRRGRCRRSRSRAPARGATAAVLVSTTALNWMPAIALPRCQSTTYVASARPTPRPLRRRVDHERRGADVVAARRAVGPHLRRAEDPAVLLEHDRQRRAAAPSRGRGPSSVVRSSG